MEESREAQRLAKQTQRAQSGAAGDHHGSSSHRNVPHVLLAAYLGQTSR